MSFALACTGITCVYLRLGLGSREHARLYGEYSSYLSSVLRLLTRRPSQHIAIYIYNIPPSKCPKASPSLCVEVGSVCIYLIARLGFAESAVIAFRQKTRIRPSYFSLGGRIPWSFGLKMGDDGRRTKFGVNLAY